MAFSIANAGAASRGYQRGIDMRLDRERMAGIEQRAEERHGIDMGDADYRAKSRLPADEALASKRGDISWTDESRGNTREEWDYTKGARLPADEAQANLRTAEERRGAAEGRAQAQEGRAASRFADAVARRVSPEMERAAAIRAAEMQEAWDRFNAEMTPLVQAGKKQEAGAKFMEHQGQMGQHLIATMIELGPQAAVAALNAWPGNKVSNAADVRQIDTKDGPMYAVVDDQGKVIIDPTTKKPMQFSEQEMRGSYARYQALKAGKGRKNVKTVKGPGGAEVLVDADTSQEIGRVTMDDNGNPQWVPAGEGGGEQAPPPKPPPNATAADLRAFYSAHGFSPKEIEEALRNPGAQAPPQQPLKTADSDIREAYALSPENTQTMIAQGRELIRTGTPEQIKVFMDANGEGVRVHDPELYAVLMNQARKFERESRPGWGGIGTLPEGQGASRPRRGGIEAMP